MKPSDDIFLLIKSMSGKEKSFFKKKFLLLIEESDNNYLKLFNEIAKQIESGIDYDESRIKNGSYSGKFIKNLPFHKNFLYNSILNSLCYFHKDDNDKFSLRNLLIKSEILSDKFLIDQSLKLLQKAKKTAVEKEIYNSQYEILNNERLIKKYKCSVEEYTILSKEIFENQYNLLELNRNLLDYYTLNENVGIFLRSEGSGRVRNKEKQIEFKKIFESTLLSDIKNAKSFLAKYIFYNLWLQYYLTMEKFEDAYKCAKSAVELCENNMVKLKSKLDNYIFSLNNLANCEIRNRKYDEAEKTVVKMENVLIIHSGSVTEVNKVFIFYSSSILRISIYMESFNESKLVKAESDIQKNIILYEDKITIYQRIILYYFLSASNFIREEFENCIYWNSKIFNLGRTDLSEDYQCYAKIIQLISYYELGYIDSMEYALKSAYHFISMKKKVYIYENIIQKYLRKSFRVKTDKEMIEMFKEMKDELNVLLKDPLEKHAFDAFNIIFWLDSKIKKIPMIEIIKESK